MRIGFDLDEVLADFLGALIHYHNDTYQTNYQKEDFFSYDFWKIWQCSKEEAIAKVRAFEVSAYFQTIQPFTNFPSHLNALAKEHELFVITARPEFLKPLTLEFLAKHYPMIPHEHVYFSQTYLNEDHTKKPKEIIAKELSLDLFIEDNLKNAHALSRVVPQGYLLHYPWNQGTLPENVIRVHSHSELTYEFQKFIH